MTHDHDKVFEVGLMVAVALVRAGCTADDLAELLPVDFAVQSPEQYQRYLGMLRRIMETEILG